MKYWNKALNNFNDKFPLDKFKKKLNAIYKALFQ